MTTATKPTMITQYFVDAACVREGLSNETWRNLPDGNHIAVYECDSDSNLQALLTKWNAQRLMPHYQQYKYMTLTITSSCKTCFGNQYVPGKRYSNLNSVKCPDCKAKPTKRTEFTVTI